ncbi:MAG: hypothetical protein SCM11_10750 [Bacillota bacterium]|nr:hypothetical protein [Bacillota bacterium]
MLTQTHQIDQNELVFLAALAGENMVVGLDDPFAGWLAEQVLDEWQRVHPEMLEKGMITSQGNGQYAVEESLQEAIKLCCKPDNWIALYDMNDKSKNSHRILHFQSASSRFVMMSRDEDNIIRLEIDEREGSIGQQICEILQVNPAIAKMKRQVAIREDVLKALMHQQKLDAAISKLLSEPDQGQQAFIKTATAPQIKTLITSSVQSLDQAPIKSWFLIADLNNAWLIDATDAVSTETVQVIDTDSQDLAERIERVLGMS